jgi:hypothetical protein
MATDGAGNDCRELENGGSVSQSIFFDKLSTLCWCVLVLFVRSFVLVL